MVELSAPDATPVIVRTWLELSLSSSASSILSTPPLSEDKIKFDVAVPLVATAEL